MSAGGFKLFAPIYLAVAVELIIGGLVYVFSDSVLLAILAVIVSYMEVIKYSVVAIDKLHEKLNE